MRWKVFRLRANACGTPHKSFLVKTIPPASIAISVPEPMAMPTSAALKAGASLIPSPTKATLPCCCKCWTCWALVGGKTPAIT